jgi:hypothetical protein
MDPFTCSELMAQYLDQLEGDICHAIVDGQTVTIHRIASTLVINSNQLLSGALDGKLHVYDLSSV